MKLQKATRRERKINKRKFGHKVDNRSIFISEEQLIKRRKKYIDIQKKKALVLKKERLEDANI